MSKSTAVKKEQGAKGEPHLDGRRQRTLVSRSKIIDAFMALTEEGEPGPSAAAIAKRAGMSLRSVFLHFDDMESLYNVANERLAETTLPILRKPYQSSDWRDQLIELIERRALVNEYTAKHRITTSIKKQKSKVLTENYRRLVKNERKALNAILPKSVQKDKMLSRSLLLATSFDSWRLFRLDEGLSNKQVIATMSQMVRKLTDHIED